MIYNIGDIVYVRNDLRMNQTYISEDDLYEEIVVPDMMKFVGKRAIIDGIDEDCKKYFIKGCYWRWVSSMFEDRESNYNLSIDLSDFV